MKRFLWLIGMALLFLFCTGCGDVFRPVIIPNPPTFPDPRAAHTVMSLSNNGSTYGSAMVVDVSGDSVASIATGDCSQPQQLCVGVVPVHAVQQSASQVLAVSQGTATSGSALLAKVIFSGTTISATPTVSLPANSMPNFVAVAPSDTTAYVSLPNLFQDPINHPGQGTVGVVSTNSNAMVATIMVGNNPVALAVTPDKNKLYVANQGNGTTGTISAFNTVDFSARTVTGLLSAAPIWLSVRSDSQRVYVLESNGTLASLDTSTSAGPDTLAETSVSVPGATEMTYDGHLNRLYIAGGSQMAVVDVSAQIPRLLKTVAIPAYSLLNLPSVNASATAVTALPDGSRAYVVSVPSSTDLVLPSQLTISSVSGDGTTATYTYALATGHDLAPGATISIAGTATGFDGTFQVSRVVSGTAACPTACFQVANTTSASATPVSGTATGENIFPQVTVVNTSSNTIKTTLAIAAFPPYDTACATARFRFAMASAGDSSRAYMSACDGGNINVIDTSTDTFITALEAPDSARPPIPPNPQQPPQNPVFLIAGP